MLGVFLPSADATTYYYQAYVDEPGTMTPLRGEWREYFGSHKAMDADDPWDTVRAPDWTGWRLRPSDERAGEELPRVFGPGTIKLSLTDIYNANPAGPMDMATALQTLRVNGKTGLFNIFDRVGFPVDRDEAYYVTKLTYETNTAYNRNRLFFQPGNEVNGNGQWNPWPDAFDPQTAYGPIVNGKPINHPDKIPPYVEGFFVEATRGMTAASDVLYGDSRAIKLLGPSVQFSYTPQTLMWYEGLMDHVIQGSYTDPLTHEVVNAIPSNMEGHRVWEYVDIVSIQYPFGPGTTEDLDAGVAVLQTWHDRFLVGQDGNPARAEGLWITEELSSGGPRQVIRRAVRFMDFVADNDLDPMQSRMVWFDPDKPISTEPAAGSFRPALEKMDEYIGEGDFKMTVQSHGTPTEHSRLYLFLNDSDPGEARIMAIYEPLKEDMKLGAIRFHLPRKFEGQLDWVVEAWQTFNNGNGQVLHPNWTLENDGTEVKLVFEVDVNQYAPVLISLTAPIRLLLGDLDSDGFVGITDLNIVLGNWNQSVAPGDPLQGDPSGDGFVGIEDLNTVLGDWNAGTPPATGAMPEPSSMCISIIGSTTLLIRSPHVVGVVKKGSL